MSISQKPSPLPHAFDIKCKKMFLPKLEDILSQSLLTFYGDDLNKEDIENLGSGLSLLPFLHIREEPVQNYF